MTDEKGRNALMAAAIGGHIEAIETLLLEVRGLLPRMAAAAPLPRLPRGTADNALRGGVCAEELRCQYPIHSASEIACALKPCFFEIQSTQQLHCQVLAVLWFCNLDLARTPNLMPFWAPPRWRLTGCVCGGTARSLTEVLR